MSRSLLTLFALTLLGPTACSRTYDMDIAPVGERYAHVFQGECSAYLRSNVTGHKYCSSPKVDIDLRDYKPTSGPLAGGTGAVPVPVPAPAPAAAPTGDAGDAGGAADEGRSGEEVYAQICSVCHGKEGKGMPGVFPPLAGSGDFYGTPQNMAKIIVGGLTGTIEVQGVTYNSAMPPQGALIDAEIAKVATYVRTHFGNSDGPVTIEDVKAVR